MSSSDSIAMPVCHLSKLLGEPHQDPDHHDYVPSAMPSCYGGKQTQKAREQASSRHQRLLERKEAEKQRALIAACAAAQERKQSCAEEEARHKRLEVATTLRILTAGLH